jgi:hypothetical protein
MPWGQGFELRVDRYNLLVWLTRKTPDRSVGARLGPAEIVALAGSPGAAGFRVRHADVPGDTRARLPARRWPTSRYRW